MNNEQKAQLIANKTNFWNNVQIPHTRVHDPQLLYDLAVMAFKKFDDNTIKASALCTMIYRVIENSATLNQNSDIDLEIQAEYIILQLAPDKTFSGIRWSLSLNIALAFWFIKVHDNIAKAMQVLQRNFTLVDSALSYGQPFTNIVKSAGLWVACAKQYKNRLVLTEETLAKTLGLFEHYGSAITKNYRFDNEWVYRELATVFTVLYSINRCLFIYKRGEVSTLMKSIETFDLLPNNFYNTLR